MNNNDFSNLGIKNEILKALNKLGFDAPTEVQEKVIPRILDKQDLIVKSQTGSGKTAAFGIPLCQMVEIEQRNPQVLVLAPTRELALQIKQDIGNIGKFRKVRACAVYGRHPVHLQERELKQRVHFVVGTPGRIMDHIERENLVLSDIRHLVIDEADEMLNMGFIDQVEKILDLLPEARNTYLFSATMPDKIEEICSKYMKESTRIEIESLIKVEDKIDQIVYLTEDRDKEGILNKIMQGYNAGSSMIFCNTRETVDKVADIVKKRGFNVQALHGGMTQRERTQTINSFKKGFVQFLVATDVAARGIDVEDVTHVINYELPFEKENYVHRIGRTGRIDNKGMAISIVSNKELIKLGMIEEYLGYPIQSKSLKELDELVLKSSKEPGLKRRRITKKDKSQGIQNEITRIRINGGKKKKIRPADVMGAIGSIEGVTSEDIGIIDIQDTCTYVEIFHNKGRKVYQALKNTSIKGKIFTVKEMKKK
ncbi:DEAD/DEAH box helicase [Alkalibacter mobilis]|uniref:DEAD/DEAH box helicase n=1 Tax=Alkalibacter mobilis TaxID=2787712 RepID=UPI00189CCF8B|nr:DEAD/DEAH box helicase [Alkalibacter mobilis]MBF7097365.1 DEAD/DEAH box helicase [Alkalibacter mobilis]